MSSIDALANRHFLVVDDESFIRTLVARFLKRSGAAEVIEAADGREAIAAIAAYDMTFDAVITDVNMRPLNGIDLLRAIRTGEGGLKRNMPVLVLTVHAEAELVAAALALDADAFVLKPVERKALIERVRRAIESCVPIAPAAHYIAVGGDAAPAALPRLAPAPPTKPMRVSTRVARHAAEAAAAAEAVRTAQDESATVVRKVELDKVKVNSVLARDICLLDTSKLLLAAPTILTKSVLDRLKDLRKVHDAYAHVFVFEPG